MSKTDRSSLFTIEQHTKSRTSADLNAKQILYFRWLDTDKQHRVPRLVKDVEERLAVSHNTIVCWNKRYRQAFKLGDRVSRVSSPEDIAGILTKSMTILKPLLDKSASAETAFDRTKTSVTAGLWLTIGSALSRLNVIMAQEDKIYPLLKVVSELGDLIAKLETIAEKSIPKQIVKVHEETVKRYGDAAAGMMLPEGSGAKVIKALPSGEKEKRVVEADPLDIDEDED